MLKIRLLFPLFVVGLFVSVSSVQAADVIRLSGPASMTDALKEVIGQYAKSGDHPHVLPNIGSSGAMAKQIKEGAPADIYISANQKWMTFLRDEKLVDPSSEKVLVHNKLVFAGKKNPAITSMADIVKLQRIAIGSPKSVPAGEYAVQAMEKVGIYKILQQGKQLIMAKDVRQALAYADRGETDGAFVYKTDAMLATQATVLFEVPQEMYKAITYPMALTVAGAEKKEAKAFYDFLVSPEALKVFSKHGFSTVH
jgi:molybdate transport system substrate-binding protein